MAQFVVNVTLIVALFLLLIVWAVSTSRRRRFARREHAEERRLILSAFTSAAGVRTEVDDDGDDHDGEPAASAAPPPTRAGTTPPHAQQLDATSVAALLDLLEDRRPPARRGMIAGLFTSPRSVWSAGTRAGQSIGRYTMGESEQGHHTRNSNLCREAAAELVDIHAHDPNDARRQYDAHADHNQVAQVVTDVTSAPAATDPQDVG